MPFRALLWTILTVALALVVIGMWLRVVEPMLATAQAAEKTPGVYPATQAAQPSPPVLQRIVVKTTLLISFILVSLLLVIGFLAMFREWVRFNTLSRTRRQNQKTPYVDAWKIAGQRLKAQPPPDEE